MARLPKGDENEKFTHIVRSAHCLLEIVLPHDS
jgi:hypothetical protein